MAQSALQRGDPRTEALLGTLEDLLGFDGPRRLLAGLVSGLDVTYDLGTGHPLLGRRMPDLDLDLPDGPRRVFPLLHGAPPVLIDLDGSGDVDVDVHVDVDVDVDVAAWDRVQHVRAGYTGTWELPVLGAVPAPSAVLVRPDGHVVWVGEGSRTGLREALTTWFGPPASDPTGAAA
jgi:hypothetical protein